MIIACYHAIIAMQGDSLLSEDMPGGSDATTPLQSPCQCGRTENTRYAWPTPAGRVHASERVSTVVTLQRRRS